MLITFVFLGLLLASGFLMRLSKDARFLLPAAVLFTSILSLVAMVCFILIVWIFSVTGVSALLLSEVNALFMLILFVALVIGIILYWIIVAYLRWKPFDIRILTVTEYIIQWSLIYVTVYQVLYDNLIPQIDKALLQNVSISTPSDLLSSVLPALLAVWIAVIMYKIRTKLL